MIRFVLFRSSASAFRFVLFGAPLQAYRYMLTGLLALMLCHDVALACEGCGMPAMQCRTLITNARTYVLHGGSMWSFNKQTDDTTVWWSAKVAVDANATQACADKRLVMYSKLYTSRNSGAPYGTITLVRIGPTGRVFVLASDNSVGMLEADSWKVFPPILMQDTVRAFVDDDGTTVPEEITTNDPAAESPAISIVDLGDSVLVFSAMYTDVIYPASGKRLRKQFYAGYGYGTSDDDTSVTIRTASMQYTLGLDGVPVQVLATRDSVWKYVDDSGEEKLVPQTSVMVSNELGCSPDMVTMVDSLVVVPYCKHPEDQLLHIDRNLLMARDGIELQQVYRVPLRRRMVFDAALDCNGTIYAGTSEGLLVFRPVEPGETPPPDALVVRAPWPQPAKSEVTIAVDGGGQRPMLVSLLDSNGKSRIASVSGTTIGTTLDVSSLEPGTYVAVLNVDESIQTTRVVVMR